MNASIPRRSHLVERAADAARIAMAEDGPRHLVERAADATRIAIADDTSLARATRLPLAPVEAAPAVVGPVAVPPPHTQVSDLLGHNELAAITRALL